MELKVTRVGNSLGVILPKDITGSLKLDKGDSLWLTPTSDGYNLTPYDPDFATQMQAARDIMKKRRQVLRELAK
jgi:putative addiction module antidote